MNGYLRVALLVESSYSFGRRLQQGVAAFSRAYGPWTFYHEDRGQDDPVREDLAKWKPDGVLARISNPRLAKQLQRLKVPIVDLCDHDLVPVSGRVIVDHAAVVKMAVDHLRECGFEHLAFTGFPKAVFSCCREQAFIQYVKSLHITPHVHVPPPSKNVPPGEKEGLGQIETDALRYAPALANWLRKLPKPIGILACNDRRAQQLLTVCSNLELEVPDRVAVIGVDNDEVCCDLSNPSLSSVDPAAFRIGFQAAEMLQEAVYRTGKPQSDNTPPVKIQAVEPVGVIRRTSTDVLAFADSELTDIVRFIRENACNGLNTSKVREYARMSRATLDRYFLKHLKRTPRAEIIRVRIERVKELLTITDLPLKQISKLAGFSHEETMYRAFKKVIGQTPNEYRRVSN
ncbi:MAG: DNA-binding transcriptional regulator [Pirellulales bacterium]|nr:DNA-binding transcriptional regulator [Pirellulales bacterium]